MKKKWMALPLLLLVSLVWVTSGTAAQHRKKPRPAPVAKNIIIAPDEIQWKDGPTSIPNAKMAVLEGDPKKGGFFVMRLKLPAGSKIQPHVHGNVERVTVISGKLYLAMGDKQQNPYVLPAGSYVSLQPKTVHNAWVEEETVLQMATNGPWTMTPMKGGE